MSSFTGVVTLYNRYLAGGRECWKRTVLAGVAVADRQGEAVRHSGAGASSARRIGPVSVGELTVLIPRKAQAGYLSPLGWRMAEVRTGRWTLQPGDVLVPERCDTEVVESIAELMERWNRVAVVSTVTDFTGGAAERNSSPLAHWEVTAR